MKERWSNASVALHWLAAALIVGLATAGFVMTDLPADSSGRLLISRLHTLGGAGPRRAVGSPLARGAGRRDARP